ncbi:MULTISPECIES: peptide ABC transporter substrate-binding protein [Rhodomicrobium]|nr:MULTISPECIES: peptide ABC transporter substrate-binding protein [Rhodomicrobium]
MKWHGAIGAAAAAVLTISPAAAQRGADGEVKILYWQAPSILNPYLSSGVKDVEASSVVLEPLASYDEKGDMVARLAVEVPTLANGGMAADLKSITWKLKPGITWSDGTPLTAEDVVFTAEYCMAPGGGCSKLSAFTDVEKVEAADPLTVKISFKSAKPFPYGPFVGGESAILQKAQFKDCLGAKAAQCTKENFAPIGTGPFKVAEFRANDSIRYVANDKYRDPAKPAFASIYMKGGGDPASAARAVLETGEFDYAWNTQVEPEILERMAKAGKGEVITAFGNYLERMHLNFTNSRPEAGDKRSVYGDGSNPHPVLKDPAMRRALALAIDRQLLVDTGYGASGRVTCNIVPAPEVYTSTAVDWCKTPDIEKANKILDEAGWKKGSDGIRVKDGVRASLLYQTSTNSVRQATQALIKQMWGDIGVATELRNIAGSVFFGADPSSPDTSQKFFADIEMFAWTYVGTDPETNLGGSTCKEIPEPKTNWLGTNFSRYCNPAYDKLAAELAQTADLAARAALVKKMNDMLVEDGVMIPLIYRGRISAISNKLAGHRHNAWDVELWNVADWTRKK